jgi:hypothetical protein
MGANMVFRHRQFPQRTGNIPLDAFPVVLVALEDGSSYSYAAVVLCPLQVWLISLSNCRLDAVPNSLKRVILAQIMLQLPEEAEVNCRKQSFALRAGV